MSNKPRRYPHTIYFVTQRAIALCRDGKSCDPHENPEHHVRLDLTEEARETIGRAADYLEESHGEHMLIEARADSDPRYADDVTPEAAMRKHRREEPDCSYCFAIEDVRLLLKTAREVK